MFLSDDKNACPGGGLAPRIERGNQITLRFGDVSSGANRFSGSGPTDGRAAK